MKRAFTLAEILSVLIILGIVASITIPSTIRHYKKQQTITRLKMAYSMLTELTERSWIENNYTLPQNLFKPNPKQQDWDRYVRPYLNIVRDCGTRGLGCFAGEGGGWYNTNGEAYSTADNGYGTGSFNKVILKNGMSLAFQSCGTCLGSVRLFVVDIDGPQKGYSIMGQDVFVFEWTDPAKTPDGVCRNWRIRRPPSPVLTPYAESCLAAKVNANFQGAWFLEGWDNEIIDNCKGLDGGWRQRRSFFQAGVGTTCAAWIIRNNWQIPDDYPWDIVNRRPANFRRP